MREGKPGEAAAASAEAAPSPAACARIAGKPDLEVTFSNDRPALTGDCAPGCSSPAASRRRPRSRSPRGSRRFHGFAARLPRPGAAPPRAPEGTNAARRVRCRRAGARRGDRRAAHGRRRRQHRRDAGGPHIIAAISRTSPSAARRRSRTPSRSWCAEKLTGQKPPASAEKIVDLWRRLDRGEGR